MGNNQQPGRFRGTKTEKGRAEHGPLFQVQAGLQLSNRRIEFLATLGAGNLAEIKFRKRHVFVWSNYMLAPLSTLAFKSRAQRVMVFHQCLEGALQQAGINGRRHLQHYGLVVMLRNRMALLKESRLYRREQDFACNVPLFSVRSEERRVGKEC